MLEELARIFGEGAEGGRVNFRYVTKMYYGRAEGLEGGAPIST
jgi:hypothetical protein